ncbi:Rv3654c family TadE-like protein [Dermacoccus nishinomiyaensis]
MIWRSRQPRLPQHGSTRSSQPSHLWRRLPRAYPRTWSRSSAQTQTPTPTPTRSIPARSRTPDPRAPRTPSERGGASVVMVGVVGMLVALFAGVATYARIAVDAERVRLAADHAALAGASVVLGAARLPAGDACAAAGHSARLNDATLTTCTELSTGVQVTASRASALGHEVTATARARRARRPLGQTDVSTPVAGVRAAPDGSTTGLSRPRGDASRRQARRRGRTRAA